MPHFGLIPSGLKLHEELLMRAKLHVRGGQLRMERRRKADAIAAFFDAFLSAMQSVYIASTTTQYEGLPEVNDIDDAGELFGVLKKKKMINEFFTKKDFENLKDMIDRVLSGKRVNFHKNFFPKYENVMTQLGVLPIKEDEFPVEEFITL